MSPLGTIIAAAIVETALATLLAAVGIAIGIPVAAWLLLAGLAALLLTQVWILRPRLDRRSQQILAGRPPPPSRQHLGYVALEANKVLMLPALGAVIITSQPA